MPATTHIRRRWRISFIMINMNSACALAVIQSQSERWRECYHRSHKEKRCKWEDFTRKQKKKLLHFNHVHIHLHSARYVVVCQRETTLIRVHKRARNQRGGMSKKKEVRRGEPIHSNWICMYVYTKCMCELDEISYFSHFPFFFTFFQQKNNVKNECRRDVREREWEMTFFLNVCKVSGPSPSTSFPSTQLKPISSLFALMLTTHFPIFNDFSCGACSNYNSFFFFLALFLVSLSLPPPLPPRPALSHRHHHRRRHRVCFSEEAWATYIWWEASKISTLPPLLEEENEDEKKSHFPGIVRRAHRVDESRSRSESECGAYKKGNSSPFSRSFINICIFSLVVVRATLFKKKEDGRERERSVRRKIMYI